MPHPLVIPPELAGSLADILAHAPEHPAVRDFLALAAGGSAWAPDWPRRLTGLASYLGIALSGPQRVRLLATGFSAPLLVRAGRILRALAALCRASAARSRRLDYCPVWGIGDMPAHRWGAPESALRPSLHVSPAGAMPAPEAAAPLPPSRPAAARLGVYSRQYSRQ